MFSLGIKGWDCLFPGFLLGIWSHTFGEGRASLDFSFSRLGSCSSHPDFSDLQTQEISANARSVLGQKPCCYFLNYVQQLSESIYQLVVFVWRLGSRNRSIAHVMYNTTFFHVWSYPQAVSPGISFVSIEQQGQQSHSKPLWVWFEPRSFHCLTTGSAEGSESPGNQEAPLSGTHTDTFSSWQPAAKRNIRI